MEKFLIKIRSWEFWPVWIIYIPVFFVWLYYAFRLRSLFFFTTINPKIEMGGFAGESKMRILNQIPKKYLPNTFFVEKDFSFENIISLIQVNKIKFPCIAKPDIGERGNGVTICNSLHELKEYYNSVSYAFIVQNYISYPLEFAILYYRMPNNENGHISSICQKEFLHVVGNGKNTIHELMLSDKRAILQVERFINEKPKLLKKILGKGEKYILEKIGNHSKGTIFLDKNELIDERIEQAFDKLSKQIPDLHFGRYDLKCNSFEELKELKNFSIIEINGVSAEPAHIYQPGYSFFEAQKQLLKQWKVLYNISKQQIAKGKKPMSFKSAINHLKAYRKQIILQAN